MSQRQQNIFVGIMAIAGLVCLAFILLLFGELPRVLKKGYEIRVELNHAASLVPDSRVKLSGIDIGKIKSVDLLDLPQRGVVLVATINRGEQVPQAASVTVETQLIGTSPTLAFQVEHLSEQQLGDFLPTDGSAVIRGRVDTLAGQFADRLQAALEEPFNKMKLLGVRWSKLAENLNRLVEPQGITSGDQANLSTLIQRGDQRLRELKTVIENFNAWVGDEQLRTDVRAAAGNARQATQKINRGAQEFGDLVVRHIAMADDLSLVIQSIQNVIDKADVGQGTVGRALNDPALYNNLNDAVERVNAAVKELQLLIQKWKKEGVPVRS